MTTTSIITAFFERLAAFDTSPEVPVMWPGVNHEPPSSGYWFEASAFPNEPTNLAWNDDGEIMARGFCQVLIGYRPGDGEIGASELADDLIAHFPKGLELGGVRVTKKPWRAPAVVEDGARLFIPVTIPYIGVTN